MLNDQFRNGLDSQNKLQASHQPVPPQSNGDLRPIVLFKDKGISDTQEFEINDILKQVFATKFDIQERATMISNLIEYKYGGNWRVIIGKHFRTCGTHFCNQFLRLQFDDHLIEIFKSCGDQDQAIIDKDPQMKLTTISDIQNLVKNSEGYDFQYQATSLQGILEDKYKGSWVVVIGHDHLCQIGYIEHQYLTITNRGVRYTFAKVATEQQSAK